MMDNLNKTDWLELALKELAAHGYGALKAQRLAKLLNVTRGSFYHHFKNIDDFNASLIQYWTEQTTEPLVRDVERLDTPSAALDNLLQQALRSGAVLERAVRSWATVDQHVGEMVNKIDQQRISFAEALLIKLGVDESTASSRAKLLYWASIGRLMMPCLDQHVLSDEEISGLSILMSERSSA